MTNEEQAVFEVLASEKPGVSPEAITAIASTMRRRIDAAEAEMRAARTGNQYDQLWFVLRELVLTARDLLTALESNTGNINRERFLHEAIGLPLIKMFGIF